MFIIKLQEWNCRRFLEIHMDDKMKTILCGGTFFYLLSQVKKKGLGEVDLFCNLYKVLDLKLGSVNNDAVKRDISKFKFCKQNNTPSLGPTIRKAKDDLNDNLQKFKDSQKRNAIPSTLAIYSKLLPRMKQFIFNSLVKDRERLDWLVKALLETIKNDDIADDTMFFIVDKKPFYKTKKEMLVEQHFDFALFLLGVFCYTLQNDVDNTTGKETILNWRKTQLDKIGRPRYYFSSDIGKSWPVTIFVTYKFATSNDESDTTTSENTLDANYISRVAENCRSMKSFFYVNKPTKFTEYYVCNDVVSKDEPYYIISNLSVVDLSAVSDHILITGSTGTGKTMMMRHLALDACNQFDTLKKYPIHVNLLNYNGENLTDFFFGYYNGFSHSDDKLGFEKNIDNGNFIFLLDGMDEISHAYIKEFDNKLHAFISRYAGNIFILSSRPIDNTGRYNKFTSFEILPFTKKQAKAMVDGIAAVEIRKQLKLMIDNDIDEEYSFWKSPLLLTLMIKNFDEFKNVPTTQHIYYYEVYKTLYRQFDKSKGLEKRRFQTGLNEERLSDYFSEFCALSYMHDKLTFTNYEFDNIFYKISERAKESNRVNASDFRDDLIENVGLLAYENGRIRFWHKSFQEYFCALYYAKCVKVDLKKYKVFFTKIEERVDKNICSIYTNLVPEEKFDDYVIYPYESYLFETFLAGNGYWSFLSNIYHRILYNKDRAIIEPFSFLYKTIFYGENCNITYTNDLYLPYLDEFLYEKWVRSEDSYCESDCFFRNRFNLRCLLSRKGQTNIYPDQCKCRNKYSEPDVINKEYVIYFDDIYKNREKYKGLVEYLESDDFILKKEYKELLSEFQAGPYSIQNLKNYNER